nr:PREDICTED: doublesex- and mab-3-related transcription factor C1-like [Equus przewalskii]
MDPNEMPAVHCCPSDSTKGLGTGFPWGIKIVPRRAIILCARCHNHGITDQIKDHEHCCLFQTCKCHKCVRFSQHCTVSPAESALKREQRVHLKRHLAQGLIRSGAAPPKAHRRVEKLAIQGGVPTGKENIMPQLEAHPCATFEEASSQGTLLIGQAPEFLSLSWTPAPLKKQLTISLSREPHRLPTLPSTHSTLILQVCATLDSILPQPQIPKASDRDLGPASSEWQRKLEAAEALLTLRYSSQAPSGSTSLLQPCAAPAPAGDRGLQPPSPSPRPRLVSSISLPIGHLGCISLLK